MSSRLSQWIPMEAKAWDSGRAFQLYEDFYNRVLLLSPGVSGYELSAREGVARQIVDALRLDNTRPSVAQFIEVIARKLFTHQEAWIEVVLDTNSKGGAPFRVFEVDGVERTKGGQLVQVLPSRDQWPDWAAMPKKWESPILLDADRIIHVSLPQEYPSDILRQVASDLSKVKSILTQPWLGDNLSRHTSDQVRVDMAKAEKTERLRSLQAALPLGWAARAKLVENQHISEYYYLFRELRFLHFMASMRESAEGALREVLTLAGRQCGFTVEVWANGIDTPKSISETLTRFEAGKVEFNTVVDMLYGKGVDKVPERRRVL